jgi:hypothetical protein
MNTAPGKEEIRGKRPSAPASAIHPVKMKTQDDPLDRIRNDLTELKVYRDVIAEGHVSKPTKEELARKAIRTAEHLMNLVEAWKEKECAADTDSLAANHTAN